MAGGTWWGGGGFGSPMPGGGSTARWDQYLAGQVGAGNPFGVGQGTPPGYYDQSGTWRPGSLSGVGVPIGGGGGGGTSGWGQALRDAYNQAQSSYGQGLSVLQGAMGNANSAFGSQLQGMFANPNGMSDAAYAGYLRQIRDREAGSRANALEQLNNQGFASGFGNSMGLLDAGARLRAQSASNLNDAELQLLMAREAAKAQQQGMSGSLLAQLLGLDQSAATALAQGYMSRPFQAFAPEGYGAGGAPWAGWTLPGQSGFMGGV